MAGSDGMYTCQIKPSAHGSYSGLVHSLGFVRENGIRYHEAVLENAKHPPIPDYSFQS